MRVLVTGATGYIGGRLVTALQELGYEVRVLVRHPARGRWDAVEQVVGNLAHPNSLSHVCQDVEVVCHLGGGMRPSDGDLSTVNVAGTRALMADAIRQRVQRFVFVSSSVVYGDVVSPPASEASVCHPLPGHAYALSKLEAEQQLHQLAHGDTDLVVTRIAQVYSAQSPSIQRFPHLAAAVVGHNFTHFIHREDVVRALVRLMRRAYAPGIYNVGDDQPLRVQEAAALIQETIGDSGVAAAPSALPPMLQRVMDATSVLDTTKIKAIGFVPKYPSLKAGLRHET